jgi:hypothetical protein
LNPDGPPQLTAAERTEAAARLEDCLQREMAYGLGVENAMRVVDEVLGPILAARALGDHRDSDDVRR